MALQLYIDSKEVVLPPDFNVTLVYENPVYTKSGSYSYDITLSLLNPTNASLYKHINRINAKQRPQQKRSAYMLVDGRVLLRGTEVITENTNTTVTIMLVSGNSELNFLIGGDLNLRDLDLGRAQKLGGDTPNNWTLSLDWRARAFRVFDDLQKKYPEVNHQLLPYATGHKELNSAMDTYQYFGNAFVFHQRYNIDIPVPNDTYPLIYYPYYSGEVPQPYLCFIIKQILKSLGYKLTFSSLENDPIRSQIYIVHGFRTFQYAKMLPNWTVNDFFDYVEQWLNAVTIVNEIDKTVEFRYAHDTSNLDIVELEAIDDFEVEYPEDSSTSDLSVTQANIAYDFPDEEYYKYACLEKDLVDNLENRSTKDQYNVNVDYHFLIDWIKEHRNNQDFFKYLINYNNDKMIGVNVKSIWGLGIQARNLRLVDFYSKVYNNPDTDDIDISFKIVPAAFFPFSLATNYNGVTRALIQIPFAENHDDLLPVVDGGVNNDDYKDPEDEVIENISEAIESESTTVQDIGGSRMTVALYSGLQDCLVVVNESNYKQKVIYPISYCSPLVEYHYYAKDNFFHSIPDYDKNIFSLENMMKDLYQKGDLINQREIFKIKFIDKPNINILSTFIIKGRKFKCLKIERDLSIKGLQSTVKGEFYPIE